MTKCPYCGAAFDAAPNAPNTCPDCGERIHPNAPIVRIRTYDPPVHPLKPAGLCDASGGLVFAPFEDGWRITGCTGQHAHIDIPAVHRGKPVLQIAERAFRGRGMQSVHLPPTVQSLAQEAFAQCLALQAVTGGEGLRHIGEKCFFNCIALSEFHSGSAPEADITAFAGCLRLGLDKENVHYRRECP